MLTFKIRDRGFKTRTDNVEGKLKKKKKKEKF
jgi:hypothetical protein